MSTMIKIIQTSKVDNRALTIFLGELSVLLTATPIIIQILGKIKGSYISSL